MKTLSEELEKVWNSLNKVWDIISSSEKFINLFLTYLEKEW